MLRRDPAQGLQLGVDGVALGDVLGAVEVVQLVEVAQPLAALVELAALARDVGGVTILAVREAVEDLVRIAWLG